MKIVIESHIPYIQGLLEPYAQVCYLETAQITAEALRDAQVLITRTRTKCNEALLRHSAMQMIAVAALWALPPSAPTTSTSITAAEPALRW